MTIEERIKQKAVELGFELAGIAPAGENRHADAFRNWLAAGRHADMDWLARKPERRVDPRIVVPGARSLIMVGVSYFIQNPPPEKWNDPSRGRIARYAWGQDYHDVITPLLKSLVEFIKQETSEETRCRYYIDTGPVLERSWSAEAGLGFIGKNTLLINPGLGSYVFLGGILTDLELDPDEPAQDDGATYPAKPEQDIRRAGTCGSCRRCLDICPTHAFPAPYILDSNRCISYLTIELRGSIPEPLRVKMSNWIFGCDECQSICPWVRRYSRALEDNFLTYDHEISAPRLLDLIELDEDGFRKRFRKTPVIRAKRRGLLRNVAVALGNWGDPSAKPALERAVADSEPLIREHAKWALERISG